MSATTEGASAAALEPISKVKAETVVSNLDIIFPMIYYNITPFFNGSKFLLQEEITLTVKKVSARDDLITRDEGLCEKSMETIEKYCREHGLQLTPVRKKVFEFLLDEPKGLGAYKILDLLRLSGFNSQPPAAYRALDFLVENGFAHKVESQNLFVACTKPGSHHSPVFMICKKCDRVSETQSTSLDANISDSLRLSGFEIEHAVIEAEGICSVCAGSGSS